MKKSKKNPCITIKPYRSPYRRDDDSLKQCIIRYFNDPSHSVCIDERTYYKVMEINEFRIDGRDYSMLVLIDNSINACIGDILIDENDNQFIYRGCAMINYGHDQYPECLKIVDMMLSGDINVIGEYLARKGGDHKCGD